jgi:16S rRNA (guanine(527)-N(7))-methyltransferase RsmG
MDSTDALCAVMSKYGIALDSPEAESLLTFLTLLGKWNRRVNLTASTARKSIIPLFEEALWAAGMYPAGAVCHLDIGSGAGFPALPMRILLPDMRLRLIESRARRAAFLETVVAELKLSGTTVIGGRIEDYLQASPLPKTDIVSWKGIRLGPDLIQRMVGQCRPTTKFWLFHGAALPFTDSEQALRLLSFERRLKFPGMHSWKLSIFAPRPGIVSRETG